MLKKISLAIMAILTTIVIFFVTSNANAQLKVDNNERIIIGHQNDNSVGIFDHDTILSASIFGKIGMYRAGSKLSFGDFGRYSTAGMNVFIGEYGTTDSDRLWLQGKNGIYITRSGQANDIVAYCNTNGSDAFYFNTKVYSKSVLLSSDSRFKSNINQIETPLNKILNIQGVSYDYNDNIKKETLTERHNINNNISETQQSSIDFSEFSEKETNNIQERSSNISQQNRTEHKLGFIAQDLQQVFPDLVQADDLGFLAVDYIGLIPVIVEAIKEQQQIINNQQGTIDSLKYELAYCCSIGNENQTKSKINKDNTAKLYQNIPNPFSENTKLKFDIPETANSAKLIIHNMQGSEIKSYNITNKGIGNITIQGSELQAGMYMYTLLIDNTIVDTKRMILTK